MMQSDFDQLFISIKKMIRGNQIDDYFRYNSYDLFEFDDYQALQIYKPINGK